MHKILAPIAVALMLGSSGMAFAATTASPMAPATGAMASPQTITDTVKAFDLNAHTLTLANGIVYKLPSTFKDPGLKPGEKVTVHWQMDGRDYDAQSVSLG